MTETAHPARATFLSLAHAEALLADHALTLPGYRYEGPTADELQWFADHAALGQDRDAELAAVSRWLCHRCGGHGVTQWRHRSGGLCFACKGDGFSAAGRRHHTSIGEK